jgi:hypothetical protein
MMSYRDHRIDQNIAQTPPFTQSILHHIRQLVHEACPAVEETMKWAVPHFMHGGVLCSMAAHKRHATFGFGNLEALGETGLTRSDEAAMTSFGRLTSISDLPDRRTMMRLVKAIAELKRTS